MLLGEQLETFSTVRFIASARPAGSAGDAFVHQLGSTPSGQRFCTWLMPRQQQQGDQLR